MEQRLHLPHHFNYYDAGTSVNGVSSTAPVAVTVGSPKHRAKSMIDIPPDKVPKEEDWQQTQFEACWDVH